MKTIIPSVMLALLSVITVKAQTTIINYDFNSASSYPVSPTANASGISCSVSSSESFQTYTGIATSTVAFVQNSTAGNALAMANSGGINTRYFMFQLSGSSLGNYQGHKIYMQPIDNVQFQATQGIGGSGNPWQTSGNNVNFTVNVDSIQFII